MSIEEQRRKAFEAFATDDGKWPQAVRLGADGQYALMQTHQDWLAWNAALDSAVIELPIIEPSSTPSLSAIKTAFRRAIEAAGLKVAP